MDEPLDPVTAAQVRTMMVKGFQLLTPEQRERVILLGLSADYVLLMTADVGRTPADQLTEVDRMVLSIRAALVQCLPPEEK